MSMTTLYPRLDLVEDSIVVRLPRGTIVASSTDGIVSAEAVILHSVDEEQLYRLGYHRYRLRIIEEMGLEPSRAIVLMTRVPIRDFHVVVDDYPLLAIVSVGLSNPACIYMERVYEPPHASTVNVFVWVSETLTMPALLDLYRVVAEAKAISVSHLLLPCRSRPMGTVSDAIAVAAPIAGDGVMWAGIATILGNRVARIVSETIIEAGKPLAGEELFKRLTSIGLEELVDSALRLYREAPIPGVGEDRVVVLLRRILSRLFSDTNVLLVLTAAHELDQHLVVGTIPGTRRFDDKRDPRGIVADELLATALALYVNGFRGLLATYWVDRVKHEKELVSSRLPVFMDDAVSALLGSALSILYDTLLGGEVRDGNASPGHGGR